MAKKTLEAALLARRDDPRALRGAITIVKGKPRIVFGVVGDHQRFSVEVKGDKFVLCDDPCKDEPQEADAEPEGEETPPEDETDAPDATDEPETAVDAEADAKVDVDAPEGEDKPLTAAEKKAKRKAERQQSR